MARFVILLSFLFLSGCATRGSVRIADLDIPIVELQKVIEGVLPLGKREQSQNGREFYSEYFIVKKGGEYEDGSHAAIRNYVHILLLGDRKPYDIDIVVRVQERDDDGSYSDLRFDEGLARVISRRVQTALHKRRDHLNIIDDFRVF